MSDVIEKLGYLASGSLLRRIYEKLQAGGDLVYKEAGIPFKSTWFPVFYVLAKSHQPLTITSITSQITFSNITVKNILRELVSEELVEVTANPSDGRSKLVSLSQEGRALHRQLEPLWNSFSIALKELFEEGHVNLLGFLTKVDGALGEKPLHKRVSIDLSSNIIIRNATEREFPEIGKLMVKVYAELEGFPKPWDQPEYYHMLANVGVLTKKPSTKIIAAFDPNGRVLGAVVFFGDMANYGSGGTATAEKNACGFRLLAVRSSARGRGVGKKLTEECLIRARATGARHMVIHTTEAMKTAWKMYENLGFKRAKDLDFKQEELQVFGFRYFFL